MRITCIIPTLNERFELPAVLRILQGAPVPAGVTVEFVVSDGGSEDGTEELAASWPGVRLVRGRPLRAAQMNAGAALASGEVLYFVHADTRPPRSCFLDIAAAVARGHEAGGYPFSLDRKSVV